MPRLTKDKLENLITNGPVSDTLKAETSYYLQTEIGKHSKNINTSPMNFSGLFGTIQSALRDQTVISISRMFDPNSHEWPLRSLPAILDKLRADGSQIHSVIEREHAMNGARRLSIEEDLIEGLESLDPPEFKQKIAEALRARLDDDDIKRKIDRLMNLRHKRIAHNEDAAIIAPPTWRTALDLVETAKEVVGVIGWTWLNTGYMLPDGESLLTRDAKRPSNAMKRLLQELGIIERENLRGPLLQ